MTCELGSIGCPGAGCLVAVERHTGTIAALMHDFIFLILCARLGPLLLRESSGLKWKPALVLVWS